MSNLSNTEVLLFIALFSITFFLVGMEYGQYMERKLRKERNEWRKKHGNR